MTKWMSIAAVALLASSAMAQSAAQAQGAAAGSASAAAGDSAAALESGTAVQAALSKSVDAKKAKPGDAVEARVQQDVKSAGRVVVPKGSKLVGHVTKAQAREKGTAESALGIAFDHAVLKNGESIAFQGVIRAIAAAPQMTASGQDDMTTGAGAAYPSASPEGGLGSAAGGAVRGIGNTAAGVAGSASGAASGAASTATSTLPAADATVGTATSGAVGASAPGIRGLPGLQIDAAGSNSTNGTVIVSDKKNVHLDSGTQLTIQVISQ